jgi:hypothetical protein
MRGLILAVCVGALLSGSAAAQNPKTPAAPTQTARQKPSPGFIDRVLKYLGISDSPETLKGLGDEVTSGELWVADLDSQATRAVASGDSFRSPVFVPGTKDILALSGADVVRLSPGLSEIKKLYSIAEVTKLVGFDADDPDSVLVLRSNDAGGHPRVGLLSLSTGKVATLAYDPTSSAELQMVENLAGWTRNYGDKQIYVRTQTKQALSGPVEWTDVFLKADGKDPMDVSHCNGVNCGQPSLSVDGRLVVFVKAKAE